MLLYSKVRFYAPNDQNQQITVFKEMINSIRCRQTVKILIGGDFNFPLSASDKFSEKQAVIIYIEDLCSYGLVDSWRKQHPHETRFAWRNSSGKIKCGLDFWLISKRLRGTDCKYQKSHDKEEISDFILFHLNVSFGELFSKITIKSSIALSFS